MEKFAGFDTFAYPGDDVMQSLFDNTTLFWCGFYLGPRFDWEGHYTKITQIGWGVAPIYIGKNPGSAKLGAIAKRYSRDGKARNDALYANGVADGNEALHQARVSKIPPPTILYFDVETTIADPVWLTYYRGWSRALVNEGYSNGLYTRAQHASWVTTRLMDEPGFDICIPTIWVASYAKANKNGATVPPEDFLTDPLPTPDPSQAWKGAAIWQHIGNFGVRWQDKSSLAHRRLAPVDFDSSIYPDPGKGILSLVS